MALFPVEPNLAVSPFARAHRALYFGIDSMLHPSLRSSDHASLWLARLLVAICLLIQLPLLRILVNNFVFGVKLEPGLLSVVLCASAAMLSIPLLLRNTGRLGLCSHLYLGIMLALMTFANLRTGGVVATVLGSVSVVVAAMVLSGPRAGLGWSAAATGQLMLTFLLAREGYEFPFPVPDEVMLVSRPMTTLTFMAVIVAFLWIHEQLRRDAMRSLLATRDDAQAAAKAKSEFLAVMSHEIRTPMNGVLGMSELLLSGQLAAEERSQVETIHSSSEALLTIINDILDFSRIEAGKLSLESVALDLEELIGSCATVLALPAEKKGLNLICFVTPETPLRLRGDPARLRQILLNLLGNALKFTNEGDICLRVSLRSTAQPVEPEATPRHLLLFEIEDSGIGISQENQRALFQAFAQADSSTTRKFGGTGLGLAISKRLSEQMGGEIGVLSELGKGSTFWFTAEFEEATEDELPTPAPPEAIRGKRLLILDANPRFCEVMRRQAESWHMLPEFACDGTAALSMLRDASEQGRPFELVSLNHEMPGMTGLEVARAMQLDERLRDSPRLLLTTARSRLPATALADAGVSISLPKPACPCDLRRAYAKVLGGEESVARQGEKRLAERPGYDSLRVLVVEDNHVNQLVVQGMLKKLGVQPDLAADGLEALEAFDVADPAYDLILMDCEMPELDGFEATQRIRSREEKSGRQAVPIVALSAHVMVDARDRMVECGMNGHIAKPISVAELIALLDSVASGEAVVIR